VGVITGCSTLKHNLQWHIKGSEVGRSI